MQAKAGKLKKRASLIAANSLYSLAQPAVNVLFSLVVIKISGTERWGGFVYYFLWASLASFVLSWGNKEFLLREFSKNQAGISSTWRSSFFTRLLLIIPSAAVLFFSFSLPETLLLIQWILLLFIAQSFDVLIVFHRKFFKSFIVELISGLILLAAIFLKTGIDIYTIYFIYLFIKAICLFVIFRKDVFNGFNIKFRFELLKGSLTFFLLSLTGLLGSRVDQYCASIMLSKEDLGKYQVLKSFLLYFQAAAGFILLPYVKNIYRLNDKSVDKIINRLFLAGAVLTVPVIFLIYIILKDIYSFSFPVETYLYSALFVLPAFYYLTVLYKFFKDDKSRTVLMFNLAGTVILFIFSVVLIPGFSINGALLAGVISGWSVAVLYYIYNGKYFGK